MKILLLVLIIKLSTAEDSFNGSDLPDTDCGMRPFTLWAGNASHRLETFASRVNLVVVQHTVSKECSADADCEGVLRGIRAHQMEKLAFTDVGQSFYIGGNGAVYEGAGWRLVGAHTKGYNKVSYGISFIGDFRKKLPTQKALQAALELMDCGVNSNYLAEDYQLVGHMQLVATESPGKTLQAVIESWPHWVKNVTLPLSNSIWS